MALARSATALGAITLMLLACSSTSSTSSPTLGSSELDVITSVIAAMAAGTGKASGSGGVATQSLSPQGGGGSRIESWCSAGSLTPPAPCPGGGQIFTTINLQCGGPSGCCGANPPCSSDRMTFGGQGTENYDSCAATSASGTHVVINGALFDGLTATFTVGCTGVTSGNVVYTISGNLSVTVDGHEVCNGMTLLTVTATVNQTISVNVSGTVCGEHVLATYDEGCVVDCGGGACCGGGTVCSTCSDYCVPAGAVDCCNGRNCPAGMRCVSGGTQCSP